MQWRAELGGRLLVMRDGIDLGPAPSRTVAVLLVGLLNRSGAWSGRSEVAQLLYPEKDSDTARNALRQALSRLRSWVGEDAIKTEADRIRLSDNWMFGLDLPSGSPAEASRIAPGLEHAWLDEIRRAWRPQDIHAELPHEAFVNAVYATAKISKDEGRAILVGGTAIFPSLAPDQVHDLLAVTRPQSRLDPYVCEYLEMRGFAEMVTCDLSLASYSFESAFKLAVEQRKEKAVPRIAAYAAFAALERGDMPGSSAWIGRLGDRSKHRLLKANLAATDAWNRNRPDEALAIMGASADMAKAYDRQKQVHFWSNYSVLAAEVGQPELSEEAEARCLEVAIPVFDLLSNEGLHAARALRLVARRRFDEALNELKLGPNHQRGKRWHLSTVYSQEIAALARLGLGDSSGARTAWTSALAARTDGQGLLNPRLKARQARIRASA